jgi:predicted molibdopterin-dependent oxidoreductase YjgC
MTGSLRIETQVQRGPRARFTYDDRPVDAYEGESVAAALWANGVGHAPDCAGQWPGSDMPNRGPPWRVLFCMMGVCQQCVVVIDGIHVEACRVLVRAGLDVRSV